MQKMNGFAQGFMPTNGRKDDVGRKLEAKSFENLEVGHSRIDGINLPQVYSVFIYKNSFSFN